MTQFRKNLKKEENKKMVPYKLIIDDENKINGTKDNIESADDFKLQNLDNDNEVVGGRYDNMMNSRLSEERERIKKRKKREKEERKKKRKKKKFMIEHIEEEDIEIGEFSDLKDEFTELQKELENDANKYNKLVEDLNDLL